jgi:hypothetical protein
MREAVFVYRLFGKLESPERPSVIVKWFEKTSVIRVEIEGDAVQPSTAQVHNVGKRCGSDEGAKEQK